jgi:hypothetical protein
MENSGKARKLTTAQKKVLRFFDAYSKNLEAVKQDPRIQIVPDESGIFLCPLCFKGFTREDIVQADPRKLPVSIEHVPPKAVGGRARTITCRSCNNSSGHYLDSHLVHKLTMLDFVQRTPGASVDARIRLNDDIDLGGTIEFGKDEGVQIWLSKERSDPAQTKRLKETTNIKSVHFTTSGKSGKIHNPRKADCNLLRIAYLWAFSVFGYGFLVNDFLSYVRYQFENPLEEALPHLGISPMNEVPDEYLGVHILTKPRELQSFMIVFDVESALKRFRYGVLLPGPTAPGANIYQALQESPQEGSITFSSRHIPENEDFINDPELCFISHQLWRDAIHSQ